MHQSLVYVAHQNLRQIPVLRGYRGCPVGRRGFTKLFTQVSGNATTSDASFDVLGEAPYNLLSVTLSASQKLFTQRGTLIGLRGNAENAHSTLSMLAPFRRAVFNIPFLYQKISSTSPVQVVISANSSLAVVRLDGSTDWAVVGRALLAWTGQTISIKPARDRRASLAKGGNSEVTGRGLLAITGQGSVYQVVLAAEEKYLLHPSNILAYTINSKPPVPYRLQSSTFRLNVPEIKLPSFFSTIRFFTVMQQTATWRLISELFSKLRTWTRRVIWGDRLFLQFHGPTTVLLQSRSPKLYESFSKKEIDQLVKLPSIAAQEAAKQPLIGTKEHRVILQGNKAPRMSVASIGNDGKVKIEAVKV